MYKFNYFPLKTSNRD